MNSRAACLILWVGICILSVHAGSSPLEPASAQSGAAPWTSVGEPLRTMDLIAMSAIFGGVYAIQASGSDRRGRCSTMEGRLVAKSIQGIRQRSGKVHDLNGLGKFGDETGADR